MILFFTQIPHSVLFSLQMYELVSNLFWILLHYHRKEQLYTVDLEYTKVSSVSVMCDQKNLPIWCNILCESTSNNGGIPSSLLDLCSFSTCLICQFLGEVYSLYLYLHGTINHFINTQTRWFFLLRFSDIMWIHLPTQMLLININMPHLLKYLCKCLYILVCLSIKYMHIPHVYMCLPTLKIWLLKKNLWREIHDYIYHECIYVQHIQICTPVCMPHGARGYTSCRTTCVVPCVNSRNQTPGWKGFDAFGWTGE